MTRFRVSSGLNRKITTRTKKGTSTPLNPASVKNYFSTCRLSFRQMMLIRRLNPGSMPLVPAIQDDGSWLFLPYEASASGSFQPGIKAERSDTSMKAPRKQIPDFATEAEEALFWQDHDRPPADHGTRARRALSVAHKDDTGRPTGAGLNAEDVLRRRSHENQFPCVELSAVTLDISSGLSLDGTSTSLS